MEYLTNKLSQFKQWILSIVMFSDTKEIVLLTTHKSIKTEYKLLLWRDSSGVCFKFLKEYGIGLNSDTILPKKRPYYYKIPILKTN